MISPKKQLKNSIKKTDKKLLFNFFMPSKTRWCLIILILLMYIFFHIYILKTNELKLNFWKNFLDNIQSLELAVLSFLITGYAIFQAFLDEKTLNELLEKADNGYIYFVKINTYFYYITIGFFISILSNLVLKNILDKGILTNIFILLPFLKNEKIQLILLLIYLLLNMILIFDIKSFLKNIYSIFVINAYYSSKINDENKE